MKPATWLPVFPDLLMKPATCAPDELSRQRLANPAMLMPFEEPTIFINPAICAPSALLPILLRNPEHCKPDALSLMSRAIPARDRPVSAFDRPVRTWNERRLLYSPAALPLVLKGYTRPKCTSFTFVDWALPCEEANKAIAARERILSVFISVSL